MKFNMWNTSILFRIVWDWTFQKSRMCNLSLECDFDCTFWTFTSLNHPTQTRIETMNKPDAHDVECRIASTCEVVSARFVDGNVSPNIIYIYTWGLVVVVVAVWIGFATERSGPWRRVSEGRSRNVAKSGRLSVQNPASTMPTTTTTTTTTQRMYIYKYYYVK